MDGAICFYITFNIKTYMKKSLKISFGIIFIVVIIAIAIISIYSYSNRSEEYKFSFCDLDGDRDCDTTDSDLFQTMIGACRNDTNYYPTIDANADGCINQSDETILFRQTDMYTYCDSNDDCWCGAFTGAEFISGEKVPSSCNLEKNRCNLCLYE